MLNVKSMANELPCTQLLRISRGLRPGMIMVRVYRLKTPGSLLIIGDRGVEQRV